MGFGERKEQCCQTAFKGRQSSDHIESTWEAKHHVFYPKSK